MRKITLDFGGLFLAGAPARREIHRYIAGKMDFPVYYGHNLDALYDCLTDITEPTAIGLTIPAALSGASEAPQQADKAAQTAGERPGNAAREIPFDAMKYLRKVRRTFEDAETENPNLAVFDLSAASVDEKETDF